MKNIYYIVLAVVFLMIGGCAEEPVQPYVQTYYDYVLKVRNSDGEPVENVRVDLYAQLSTETFVRSDSTDATGVIVYDSLYVGKYSVYASFIPGVVSASKEIVVNTVGENMDSLVISVTPRPNNSPIVITGFLSDPRGKDGAAPGTSSSYSSTGVTVFHDGGYEYVQLLALEDIDFSATPFSVVICENGTTAPEHGWAEGGAVTYKFDLTEGTVARGSFFYIGGSSKVIAGYGSCGKSTDISNANWIRTLDCSVDPGDGFGDPSGGLLGNYSSSGNNADGIAVFEGTDVTEASVPLDAVFYGDIVVGYDSENNWGYRIPNNDHYSRVNPETGDPQPFFGQGTNTYLYSQPAKEGSLSCDYSKLGGIITRNMWLAPRSRIGLILSCCPGEASLSDIESGNGITQFLGSK